MNKIFQKLKKRSNSTTQGFTLIEVLIVVTLIAILSTITIIAVNPAKHYADTRNAQRSADTLQLLNAIGIFLTTPGNKLSDLGTINLCSGVKTKIGTTTPPSPGDYINLSTTLVDTYLVAIPKDPDGGTDADTKYTLCKITSSATSRIQIDATNAENGAVISIKR
jgi:prepilin-type N-terminal cleavage/methylation domain-containing protein